MKPMVYTRKDNNLKKEIIIEGMSCKHCVKHVTNALEDLKEVNKVKVSLDDNNAIIDLKMQMDDQKIIEAIEEVGYKVVEIK